MALPKLTTPLFDITLPISQQDIRFRPFLVKEEKVLLIGKEGDYSQQMLAVKQLLQNVIVEPANFKVDELTIADMEYLFIQLRAKSVQNVVELRYRDKEDDQIYKFTVDLETLTPSVDPNHKYEIQITDDIGVVLKDPTIGMMSKIKMPKGGPDKIESDLAFMMIASCIDKVYDADQVYDDFTNQEAVDFLKGMEINQFDKIREFYETAPKIVEELKYVNKNGTERTIKLEGINDFF